MVLQTNLPLDELVFQGHSSNFSSYAVSWLRWKIAFILKQSCFDGMGHLGGLGVFQFHFSDDILSDN